MNGWGNSNLGWAMNYYWFGKSSSDSVTINWLPTVSGYNINDYNYGFSGDFGRAVVALKINTGIYSVHEIGGDGLLLAIKHKLEKESILMLLLLKEELNIEFIYLMVDG